MTLTEIMDLTDRYVMKTYGRLPIAFVRGEGTRLWDTEGKSYLDFLTGIAVCGVGHSHPKVAQAIAEQARTLMHTSNLYYIEPQARLAQKLVECSAFDQVFFCNSGAEANEAALKLARKYGHTRLNQETPTILSTWGSFHGRTLATVTATGQEKYHHGFEPLVSGFVHVPYNDLDAMRAAVTDQTCAILVEPIQGESGVHVPDEGYLPGLRELCDEKGMLLIVDEVQTGLGRTGKLFAYEHTGIEPDVMTLAKGIAGGLPMGALLAKAKCAVFEPGNHASTFGGNFLACAAALAVLEILLEDGVVENARVMGEYFQGRLRELQAESNGVIVDVRGRGLMIGVELATNNAVAIQNACRERGLILNAIGDHIFRFHPPLTVTQAEIDEAIGIVREALLQEAGSRQQEAGGR